MVEELYISWDKIKVFVVVGQVKDLKIAATILHKDVTNVVRNLKDLETSLKMKLYNRSSNKITLTEEGEFLFLDYEQGYNAIILAGKKKCQRKNLDSGKLSIGISYNLDLDILTPLIIKFKKQYPKVLIKIVNIDKKEIYDNLKQYRLDFIITEEEKMFKSFSMYNLDLDLCLAYKKTYFKDYLREIADLKNETIIAPSKSKNESILLAKEFKKANIPLNIAIESSSYKTSLNYAKSGLGVALIPIAYTNKESVEVIPLKIKKSLFLYFIDNTISPTTEVFLKDLKENFGIN